MIILTIGWTAFRIVLIWSYHIPPRGLKSNKLSLAFSSSRSLHLHLHRQNGSIIVCVPTALLLYHAILLLLANLASFLHPLIGQFCPSWKITLNEWSDSFGSDLIALKVCVVCALSLHNCVWIWNNTVHVSCTNQMAITNRFNIKPGRTGRDYSEQI